MTPTQTAVEFRVDKGIVIRSYLLWQVLMEIFLLLLSDRFHVDATIRSVQFWWLTGMIVVVGMLIDFWEIRDGRLRFQGTTLLDFSNRKKPVDLLEVYAVRDGKTIYGKCLALEYKVPKGLIARELLQYNFYSAATLRKILKQVVTINPQLELDDLAKAMLAGTYKPAP